jgi:leader peptidase (prepilin peptidase)/N-methyltransferase
MMRLTPWARLDAVLDGALGAAVGAGLTYGMGVFGKVVFGKQAMGFGDVMLMAMIGAFLGWKAALMVFFIAPVFGAIFGVAARVIAGERYVRYGPFLAGATVLVIFYEPLLSAYAGAAFTHGGFPEFHHRVPFLGEPDRLGTPW